MTRGIFITGTDTGVGKSLIACALIHAFKMRNLKVAGMKPVASGSVMTAKGLRNEDALALQSVMNVHAPYRIINPYCFAPAIAPHLAARDAGVSIDLEHAKNCYAQLAAVSDLVIVEGAGGWRVPLQNGYLSDLPEALQLDVVLVVGMRLGCLNHALLTAEAVESGGPCRLAGWVANVITPEFSPLEGNLETLQRCLRAPFMGLIPHLETPDVQSVADVLDISVLNPRQ